MTNSTEPDPILNRNWRLHVGDQADKDLLRSIVRGMKSGLDVVVDDGGHLFHQQIASFLTLFPLMNGGGIYIIEAHVEG